jgi:hypothetical protein
MEMFSSVCVPSKLCHRRYSSLPCLKLPSTTNNSIKSLPVTTIQISNSPRFFISDWQEEIDRDFLHLFNIIPNEIPMTSKNSLE